MRATRGRSLRPTQHPPTRRGSAPRLTTLLAGLSSQLAFVAAGLYYFGWAKSQATLQYFGLDTSFTDYSTTDYVLRSIALIFQVLVPAVLVLLLATFAHSLVVTPLLASSGRARDVAACVMRAVRPACLVLLVGVVSCLALQWSHGADLGVALPLTMTLAIAAFAYCDHVDLSHALSPTTAAHAAPRGSALLVRRATMAGLFVAGVFWCVGLYAADIGQSAAVDIARGARGGTSVTLYTTEGDAITGPGIVATKLDPGQSKYHYRYTGLRLFLKTKDHFFLLPANWQKGRDSVIDVPDNDDMRVDLGEPTVKNSTQE